MKDLQAFEADGSIVYIRLSAVHAIRKQKDRANGQAELLVHGCWVGVKDSMGHVVELIEKYEAAVGISLGDLFDE